MVCNYYKEQKSKRLPSMRECLILSSNLYVGEKKDKGQRLYFCTIFNNVHANLYYDLDFFFILEEYLVLSNNNC